MTVHITRTSLIIGAGILAIATFLVFRGKGKEKYSSPKKKKLPGELITDSQDTQQLQFLKDSLFRFCSKNRKTWSVPYASAEYRNGKIYLEGQFPTYEEVCEHFGGHTRPLSMGTDPDGKMIYESECVGSDGGFENFPYYFSDLRVSKNGKKIEYYAPSRKEVIDDERVDETDRYATESNIPISEISNAIRNLPDFKNKNNDDNDDEWLHDYAALKIPSFPKNKQIIIIETLWTSHGVDTIYHYYHDGKLHDVDASIEKKLMKYDEDSPLMEDPAIVHILSKNDNNEILI